MATAAKTVKAKPGSTGTPRPKRITIKAPSFLRSIGGYFKGAWQELRAVRWPNRRATWGLTLAVILYSAFFAVIILGLDAAFNYLFKEVLL